MSNLVINDLPKLEELDRAAFVSLSGGMRVIGMSFIRPYTEENKLSPYNIFNYIINNEYTIINQNPISIYVNNDNSGNATNNITATSVSAASPSTILNN